MDKIPCSVGILTFNSGQNLRKCLESVSQFDEIIICDGGSSDDTLDIAKEFDCTILEQDKKYKYDSGKIADFSGVRNQTYNASRYDWFFYVDSDEYVSEELVNEIREIIQKDSEEKPKVYKNPRKFIIDGKIIDCASAYPNYHIRFFHRNYVSGFRKEVHEKPIIKEGAVVSKLKNVTYVPTESDYKAIKQKQDYYLKIEGARYSTKNRTSLFRSIFNTTKALVSRLLKTITSHVFCRGNHMPLMKEWYGARYHLLLLKILVVIIFKIK